MSRIFLSHSSLDTREAVALKQWLAEQDPPLANEIFLDVDPGSGLQTGTRWKDALRRANARCEAVICLLSPNWEASQECRVEYRTAENLNKQIFMARLEPSTGDDLTSEWQRCDLFDDGKKTQVDVGGGPPVEFATGGLYRLRDSIRGAGIGAESFVWPPPSDVGRAPYRGWEPLEETDAAVFFGRDAQIVKALDALRGMRLSGTSALFVVLGPSGTGKSSFLRAGVLPRLRREDRRFALLDIVRPERNALTGDSGFAHAIAKTRSVFGLSQPSLGDIKTACANCDVAAVSGWLAEIREAAASRMVDRDGDQGAPAAPTLVLPLDQTEELFSVDSGESADIFLRLLAGMCEQLNATEIGLAVAATIRTDRYEALQTHPALTEIGTLLFDELKPMPPTQFKEVITGPGRRATEAGRPLTIAPDLVDRLLADAAEGADTLPMLALTMARLYTDYGSTGELTLAQYESMGGMRRVVQTEIDEVLSFDPRKRADELAALRAAFIPWLATVNPDNDQPMRRVARWTDLPEASRPLIDALVAKRLMVKDTRDGEAVVEVALESLLRQWDTLAGWLRDQRKDLKDADDLERSAADWVANAQDPAWLLSGSRLLDAENLREKAGFRERLSGTMAYLSASRASEEQRRAAEEEQRLAQVRAAEERAAYAQERQATAEAHTATLRRRSRVLRAVLAMTVVAAVIAAVGFVWANSASREAQRQYRTATSQRLVADSQAIMGGTRPGGDVKTMQQLLAAGALTGQPDRNALYDAVVRQASTLKVMTTPDFVYSPVFSPDGKLIAAGNSDGKVRIWDAESGQLQGDPLEGHEGGVPAIAIRPDGKLLASAGLDGTIRMWDVQTGDPVGDPGEVEGGAGLNYVAFGRDGRFLATRDAHRAVQVWDAESLEVTGPPIGTNVDSVTFSGHGTMAASNGNEIQIFSLNDGRQIGEKLTGHTGKVSHIEFSPDGKQLVSTSLDTTVRRWDAATGEALGPPLEGHTKEVTSIAVSPDGRLIASGSADNTVRLWSTATGQPVGNPVTGPAGIVLGLAFDPQGRRLAVGSSDFTLRILDVASLSPLTGESVTFSPDGNRIATGGVDGLVRLWDAANRTEIGSPRPGHTGEIVRVAYSPDGATFVSAGEDGRVRFWDAATGEANGAPIPVGTPITAIAFDSDGRRIVTGGTEGAVRVWDVDSRRAAGEPMEGHGAVVAAGFFDDGTKIGATYADATGGSLMLWRTESGEVISDDSIGSVSAGAFGVDDRVAVGALDGNVAFYSSESGEPVREPVRGHVDAVASMAFSPDGHRAVTGGRDAAVRLWDADTGEAIGAPVTGQHGLIGSVAFSPDGERIAAAAHDNVVWLWPATAAPDDLCSKLTANMSHKQWNEWVSTEIDYIKTCPDLPIAD